ncbi:T3SS (YopN, CesT) and YbjN peptide-binding chaperone 1 [Nitriliruptor alkaliphilus]|uniref:T3SS (YopN, CesT) and YbjN peptide-binding chaperone 1 n=1 Tax=Nitriliruptor alkaliphilus TaxID=427918 RepID=UPI0006975E5B|nr:YbjN domain-containing protein [Nitriliruptor alkaliphilus]
MSDQDPTAAREDDEQQPAPDEPDDTATPGGDEASASDTGHDPSSALAAVARSATPPRPPRRTGVFIDPDDLRTHVGGLLRAILGGYEVDAFGNYTFTHEGARIFVTVSGSPIGPQVGVFSVTNVDVELTPDLAAFLLTTNHTLGFGAFSYDVGNRAVWLRHTLLGTTLDGPELQSAVAAVATTAARLDHPIRDRFGGGTFADAPDDVQRGVEPPRVDPEPPAPNASGYL